MAASYQGWKKTALQPFDHLQYSDDAVYGGATPAWTEIGGYDIAGDKVIEGKDGFDEPAVAAGVTLQWDTLVRAASDFDAEIIQIVSYDGDRLAALIDLYAIPPPLASEATAIAVQERKYLQTLLVARDRAAGTGGIKQRQRGEGSGEEFESLAVLDRRIAKVRARIAWFESAAAGNIAPRQEHWKYSRTFPPRVLGKMLVKNRDPLGKTSNNKRL